MNYFQTKAYRNAINPLKAFESAQPKHPRIHGILGICYENVNDLQSAYNQYLLQVKIDTQSDIGRHASTRIEVLRTRIR
jgi:Tfp pilus assembly protein PilF